MSGIENDVLVAKNVNFDYTSNPPHTGIVTADAQLLIGSVGSTPNVAISKGNLISNDNSIDFTYIYPNINCEVDFTNAFPWLNIGTSQTLAINTGYFCSSGGALSLALPTTSLVGDTISVVLDGSTSWTITQGAGQRIRLGNTVSTTGVGGSIASNLRGDTVTMVCQTANTFWVVTSSVGNITVT